MSMKIFAAHYVDCQENINDEDKIKFLNFIKEADDSQLVALLTTGKMLTHNELDLSEGITDYIPNIYKPGMIDSIKVLNAIFGPVKTAQLVARRMLPHAALAAAIITTSVVIYKRFLAKAARACKGKSGTVKSDCINNFKIKAHKEQIKKLSKDKSLCKKSKNPAKCVYKVGNKIAKIKKKIQKHTP